MNGILEEGLRKLLGKRNYYPLNILEISRKNLISNYKYLKKITPKVKIAPVLKSNAYGHGLVEIARILAPMRPPYFCVDSIFEAYELFKSNIKSKILIMGYIDPENLKIKNLPFDFAVSDLKTLQAINDFQPQAGVHLFVDTGMNREGIPSEQLPIYLKQLERLPNIKVEGVMSHFASADEKSSPSNKEQIKNFQKALDLIKKEGYNPKWIHIQNSDGLLGLHPKGLNVNLARVGLALYSGVLNFKTKIIQIKRLKRGDKVGYSGKFSAKKDMVLGVLPVGYFDGVDRRLSNKGFVTINNVACPIVGLVSMNITTIDLSQITNPVIGQEVIIYSNNSKDPNSIENVAKICKTIPYEILVHLAPTTRKVIV